MNQTLRRERRRQMAKAVESGVPQPEVARKFGVGLSTVYCACRENNVATLTRLTEYEVPRVNSFAILKALLENRTYQDIADQFRITKQRVEQIAKRASDGGWELPQRGQRGRRVK